MKNHLFRNSTLLLVCGLTSLFITGCTITKSTVTPTIVPTTTPAETSTPTIQPTTVEPTTTSTVIPDNLSELWITNSSGQKILVMIEIPQDAAFIRGLEGRDTLPENQGMFFQWQEDVTIAFQMWHTSLPLSIAFISGSGEILEIQDMKPFYPPYPEGYTSSTPYRYALEVNQGFFTRNNICIGNTIEFTS